MHVAAPKGGPWLLIQLLVEPLDHLSVALKVLLGLLKLLLKESDLSLHLLHVVILLFSISSHLGDNPSLLIELILPHLDLGLLLHGYGCCILHFLLVGLLFVLEALNGLSCSLHLSADLHEFVMHFSSFSPFISQGLLHLLFRGLASIEKSAHFREDLLFALEFSLETLESNLVLGDLLLKLDDALVLGLLGGHKAEFALVKTLIGLFRFSDFVLKAFYFEVKGVNLMQEVTVLILYTPLSLGQVIEHCIHLLNYLKMFQIVLLHLCLQFNLRILLSIHNHIPQLKHLGMLLLYFLLELRVLSEQFDLVISDLILAFDLKLVPKLLGFNFSL